MNPILETPPKTHPRKTYFGLAALVTGVISLLLLGAHFGVAYLNISPALFSRLNILTTLFFCILSPLTVILGIVGHLGKNDSKPFSRTALVLGLVPFFILSALMINDLSN